MSYSGVFKTGRAFAALVLLAIVASCARESARTHESAAAESGPTNGSRTERARVNQDASGPASVASPFASIDPLPGLRHVFRLTPSLYCGSEPNSDDAFRSLEQLGVRTAISVDGATPDLDRAAASGIRYVHLPIGYDGISVDRGRNLVYAVEHLEGAIYIHCHKGIHRGPAAAAFVLAALRTFDTGEAIGLMHAAGTSEMYSGLYAAVRGATSAYSPPPDGFEPELPSSAARSSMTMSMVDIEQSWERIEACHQAGWATPKSHPDVDCAAECVILMEHFREARRLPEMSLRPAGFDELMKDAEDAALALSKAIQAGGEGREAGFREMEARCTDCHAAYRN